LIVSAGSRSALGMRMQIQEETTGTSLEQPKNDLGNNGISIISIKISERTQLLSSVGDPDPEPDPDHIFLGPGSGSGLISQRYGSFPFLIKVLSGLK
jgi:hypothetical protein